MPRPGSARQTYACTKMAAFWVAVLKGGKNGRKMTKPGRDAYWPQIQLEVPKDARLLSLG